MKQALAQLGAAQRAKQGRTPRAHARPKRGSANGLDRHSECVRAAMLFARWQRCGMGRISLMNGCACGIDAAIEIGGLEAMILDHLLQRFVHVEQLLQALWHAPIRTMALAQGRAWGAGADLLAACEVRHVREDASFRFPGARFHDARLTS